MFCTCSIKGGIFMAWLTGYPRERLDWHPTIDKDKCVKCGMCMNCGKDVYNWLKDGPEVARPLECIVGCTTCANLCMGRAITFPDIETVRAIYKEQKIWQKVKEDLKKSGKLTDKGQI